MTSKVFELLRKTIRGKAPEDNVFTRERNSQGYRTRKDGHIVDVREAWGQDTKHRDYLGTARTLICWRSLGGAGLNDQVLVLHRG